MCICRCVCSVHLLDFYLQAHTNKLLHDLTNTFQHSMTEVFQVEIFSLGDTPTHTHDVIFGYVSRGEMVHDTFRN